MACIEEFDVQSAIKHAIWRGRLPSVSDIHDMDYEEQTARYMAFCAPYETVSIRKGYEQWPDF